MLYRKIYLKPLKHVMIIKSNIIHWFTLNINWQGVENNCNKCVLYKGSPRSASLDKFVCWLEGSSWVYGWTAWQIFLLFFLSSLKMDLVFQKQVLDLFIMFSTKTQRWPLHQSHLEMHWGGDPLHLISWGWGLWGKEGCGKIEEGK